LICDEIENFDDKLLHAAQQSDLLKKNLHATMQLTIIAGRKQKQRHYVPVVYFGSLFRTQHAVKKKIWRMCEAMQIAAHIHSRNTDNKRKVLVQRKERAVRFILRANIMCMMIVS
jgi:hypothetical protein